MQKKNLMWSFLFPLVFSMERKVHLAGPRQVLYPSCASVSMYVTPWGVELTTAVRFAHVPSNETWTFKFPVNPSTTILDIISVFARTCGRTFVQHRRGPQCEFTLVTHDILPMNGPGDGLTFVVVTAQPVSYKRLFVDWLYLGTPAHPCPTTFSFDVTQLAKNVPQIGIRPAGGKPFLISPRVLARGTASLTEPLTFDAVGNVKLTVRFAPSSDGFALSQPVCAVTPTGTAVMLHTQPERGGVAWHVKRAKGEPGSDNVLVAQLVDSPPADAVLAVNSDLVLAVGAAILDETAGGGPSVAPVLCPTNLSQLLTAVEKNTSCWTVSTPRAANMSHPDVQLLQRILHVTNPLKVGLRAFDRLDERFLPDLCHIQSDVVCSMIACVLDD